MHSGTGKLDSELETVLRRWSYAPPHVRQTFAEVISHYGPPGVESKFPTPANATWNDVEIVLLSPHEARITIGALSKSYTFAVIGLADTRRPKIPRAEWRMLRTYAENPEGDAYYKLPKRENLKMDISKFRRWLQSFFGIPGDPLQSFQKARWLPRFKIRADY